MDDTTIAAHGTTQSGSEQAQSDPWLSLGTPPSTVAGAAAVYDALGWHPVPIRPHNDKHPKRGKAPKNDNWQKADISARWGNLDKHFPQGTPDNIGVRLGFPYAGSQGVLGDVDLDRAEAIALAPLMLPKTLTFGRDGARNSHWLYDVTGDDTPYLRWTRAAKAAEADDEGVMIVELRTRSKAGEGGLQTVFPPSIHGGTLQPIRWTNWGARPTVIAYADLKRSLDLLALAAILVGHWVKGQRYHLSLAASRFLLERGVSEGEARELIGAVCAVTASDDRSTAVDETQRRMDANEPATGTKTLLELIGEDDVRKIERWLGKPKRDKHAEHEIDGFICHGDSRAPANNHAGNVRTALDKLGVAVSYDEFADRTLVSGLAGFGPLLDDAALVRLWLTIDETFKFRPHKEFFFDVIADTARQNSFHPVRRYLDGLTWDGTPRLDGWLVTYGGAEDSEYVRAVGALTLIAAVRRVRKPGCKFDEMMVLESPQGKLKSSALALLAGNPEWFTDDLPLHADGKVVIEQTLGKWIAEASDLAGMRKTEVDLLKSFMSRQHDRARMAYGRTTTERARQFIIVGTTNNSRYLLDSTGNRRFWPVKVDQFDLDALARDRDQLWAEAAAREARGEGIRLDSRLWGAAGIAQEERRLEDPWEEVLERSLGDIKGKLRAVDAWIIVGVPVDRRTQEHKRRLGQTMRILGFERAKLRFGGPNNEGAYVRGEGDERDRRIYLKGMSAGYWMASHEKPNPQDLAPDVF